MDLRIDLDFPDFWLDAYPDASVLELGAMNHDRKEQEDFDADHGQGRKAFGDGE